MKTRFYLIPLLFFLFVACSGDDDEQEQLPVTIENLTGIWLAVEFRESNGAEFGPFQTISQANQYTFSFKSDFSFINASQENCDGVFEISENQEQIIFNYDFDCSQEVGTFSVQSFTENILVVNTSSIYEGFILKFIKQN